MGLEHLFCFCLIVKKLSIRIVLSFLKTNNKAFKLDKLCLKIMFLNSENWLPAFVRISDFTGVAQSF